MHSHLLEKVNINEKLIAFEALQNQDYKFKKPSKRKIMSLLKLSKSTFYENKNRTSTVGQMNKLKIQNEMVTIFEESGQVYGTDKVREALIAKLNNMIHVPSRATINRYMNDIGLHPIIATRKNSNAKSKENSKFIHNNYLAHWRPDNPGTHFVTDITYVHTNENGWVYLLSYMDLFTRQIVAFDVSNNMDAEWVTSILVRLIKMYPNAQMVHSDRGTQYKSELYKTKLAENNIIQSYSKKGYPYDNAWIESFHKSIKQEKLKHENIKNLTHAYQLCCEYILTFYNTTRIHSAIGYVSPNKFAENYTVLSA